MRRLCGIFLALAFLTACSSRVPPQQASAVIEKSWLVEHPIVSECLDTPPAQEVWTEQAATSGESSDWFRGKRWEAFIRGTSKNTPPAERLEALKPLWASLTRALDSPIADPLSTRLARDEVRLGMVQAHAKLREPDEIDRLMHEALVSKSVVGATVLVEAAEAYVRLGVRLDDARNFLRRAAGILLAYEQVDPASLGTPRYVWERKFAYLDTRLLIALGRLEARVGNRDRATRVFTAIFESRDSAWARKAFAEALKPLAPVLAAEQYGLALATARPDERTEILEALAELEHHADVIAIKARAREQYPVRMRAFALQSRLDETLPEFSMQTLDGRTLDSRSLEHSPGVVLLTFFETECGPCVAEQPVLEKVRNVYGKRRVKVIVLGLDGMEELRRFVETENRPGFEYGVAPKQGVRERFAVRGVPALFILKDGRIRFRNDGFGPLTESVITWQVGALLDANVSPPIEPIPDL